VRHGQALRQDRPTDVEDHSLHTVRTCMSILYPGGPKQFVQQMQQKGLLPVPSMVSAWFRSARSAKAFSRARSTGIRHSMSATSGEPFRALRPRRATLISASSVSFARSATGTAQRRRRSRSRGLLAQKSWIVPLFGTRRLERFEENILALSVRLTEDETRALNDSRTAMPIQGNRYPDEHMRRVGI
jgi:hypothetical protein